MKCPSDPGRSGSRSETREEKQGSLVDVFISATREVHYDDLIAVHLRRGFFDVGERVGCLESGDDAIGAGKLGEGVERFIVGRVGVVDTAFALEPGVLGADGSVIQAG